MPFVSYEVRQAKPSDKAEFVAKTPMAEKFLRLILEYTHIFTDSKQLFEFVKQQFGLDSEEIDVK